MSVHFSNKKRKTCYWSLTYLLTYLLTPWCRVLLEQLTGLQLFKKFPAFHGTRSYQFSPQSEKVPNKILISSVFLQCPSTKEVQFISRPHLRRIFSRPAKHLPFDLIKQYIISPSICPWRRQWSKCIPANAGFLSDKVAVLGEKIKGTLWTSNSTKLKISSFCNFL